MNSNIKDAAEKLQNKLLNKVGSDGEAVIEPNGDEVIVSLSYYDSPHTYDVYVTEENGEIDSRIEFDDGSMIMEMNPARPIQGAVDFIFD